MDIQPLLQAEAGTSVAAKRVVSPALVGRTDELHLVATAVSSPPAVVVVEGEAGIGKTRLVAELATLPELAGRQFVTGACRRVREPFPLGAVIEAIGGLGEKLASANLSPVTGVLRPLLPEVAELLPPTPEPLGDRLGDRHRVFRGLTEVLDSLGPAVLVLEDLHWADEQTVDFVSYLVSEPIPNLSLVLTFRGEDVDPRVRSAVSKLPASVNRTAAILAPMDAVQTGALAAAILGVERVTDEFAAYLCERASGLPLAIEELLALLQARGTLVHAGSGWARKALDELDVPTGIRDSVLERVGRLPGAARSVADAAAVLQTPVDLQVLARTCGTPSAQSLPGLDEALDSGLLTEHGDAVGFRHPLAAQSVYEALPRSRQVRLHGRAANALLAIQPPPLGQVAHHLRQAGRLDDWVNTAERAADQAVGLGHDAEAARLLEEVLRHASLGPERRGRVAVKLAQAVIETVHPTGDVTDLLSEVLNDDLPSAVRGELQFRLGLLLEYIGSDALLTRRIYAAAIEDLGERPELQAWAMLALGIPAAPGVSLAEHAQWVRRALDVLPAIDDAAFEVFLLGKAAMALVCLGDPAWRELTDRIVDRTSSAPTHRREVNAYYSIGIAACYNGHHEPAQQLLTRALEGARACESRELELRTQAAFAVLGYCQGSWKGLTSEVALLIEELADYPNARVDAELVAGCLALSHGDLYQAQHRLTDVTQTLEQMGGRNLLAIAVSGLLRVSTARGEPSPGLTSMRKLVAAMESKSFWAPAARALPAATNALVSAGQHLEASALVDRCARELAELESPLGPAALRHARGMLASSEHLWCDAAEHLLAAADLYDSLHCVYEAAQSREQAATALLAGASGGAEEQLRVAATAYQDLGASWDHARLVSVARQHGLTVPPRHGGGRRSYGLELSPREYEVASLAATGRTNKEIASELFLSPNTVDKHVRAILRKLGLHSRTALAYHLTGGNRPPRSKNGGYTP